MGEKKRKLQSVGILLTHTHTHTHTYRHLGILNCTLPAAASIDKIFGSMGCGYFTTSRGFAQEITDTVKKLVNVTRFDALIH